MAIFNELLFKIADRNHRLCILVSGLLDAFVTAFNLRRFNRGICLNFKKLMNGRIKMTVLYLVSAHTYQSMCLGFNSVLDGIEILGKTASARYLGQKITFEDQETEEIKNRMKAAWAAFHKYRQELTSKDYRFCHRLRLFQHGGNTDDDLCQQHVDIDAETREDDRDSAAKDASPDCTDETKI